MEIADMTIKDFIEKTASSEPTPGGGSVAALGGALSGALAEMVAKLTIDKEGYEDVQEEMRNMLQKVKILRMKLMNDIQRDTNSFNKYIEALRMPKETEQQKEIRSNKMQEGLKDAAIVPLEIANTAYAIMKLAELAIEKGNKNAVTDGFIAAMIARTAVLSALLNTKINLASIKDEQFVKEYTDKVNLLEFKALEYENKILRKCEL